jgi:hypothetical protein
MAKEAKTQPYYVKMGGVKYGFRVSPDAYKGIEKELGVVKAKDTDNDVVYGADNKPPRVNVNCANGRTYVRFCDPSKLEGLITKGSLNKKKLNGQEINSVRAKQ